eukprot:1156903-Pelagomonas_calceolata.AAC.6
MNVAEELSLRIPPVGPRRGIDFLHLASLSKQPTDAWSIVRLLRVQRRGKRASFAEHLHHMLTSVQTCSDEQLRWVVALRLFWDTRHCILSSTDGHCIFLHGSQTLKEDAAQQYNVMTCARAPAPRSCHCLLL